jgi:hypothetical protein
MTRAYSSKSALEESSPEAGRDSIQSASDATSNIIGLYIEFSLEE